MKVVGLLDEPIDFEPVKWSDVALQQMLHLVALEAGKRNLPDAAKLHQVERAWQRRRIEQA